MGCGRRNVVRHPYRHRRGMIREMLQGIVPMVLRSDFYAAAALMGGGRSLCYATWGSGILRFAAITLFGTGLRLPAMKLRIQLSSVGYFSLRGN